MKPYLWTILFVFVITVLVLRSRYYARFYRYTGAQFEADFLSATNDFVHTQISGRNAIRGTLSSGDDGVWITKHVQLPTPPKNTETILKFQWEGQLNYIPESGQVYVYSLRLFDASDNKALYVALRINSAGMSEVVVFNKSDSTYPLSAGTTISQGSVACDVWTNITQVTMYMFLNINGTDIIGHRGRVYRNGARLHMWEHRVDEACSDYIPDGSAAAAVYIGRDSHTIQMDTYELTIQAGA
jgi:hypothetical protein